MLVFFLLAWNTKEKHLSRQLITCNVCNLVERDSKCLKDLQATVPSDDKAHIEWTKGGLFNDSYH